jgi:hypothetical protein
MVLVQTIEDRLELVRKTSRKSFNQENHVEPRRTWQAAMLSRFRQQRIFRDSFSLMGMIYPLSLNGISYSSYNTTQSWFQIKISECSHYLKKHFLPYTPPATPRRLRLARRASYALHPFFNPQSLITNPYLQKK